ncbi:UNVERIFIED_CONTAM: hypothetical protein FKN15_070845 [Acipenser sinensis]
MVTSEGCGKKETLRIDNKRDLVCDLEMSKEIPLGLRRATLKEGTYRPLLKQVVEEIFHPDRPDPVDIEHMSAGLTDLLKTGFSMFMKISLEMEKAFAK